MLDANPKLYTVCDSAELLHKALSLTAQGTPCKSVSKSLLLPSLPSISFFYLSLLFFSPLSLSSLSFHGSFVSEYARQGLAMVVESLGCPRRFLLFPTAGCWDAKGIHSIVLIPSLLSPQKSWSAWASLIPNQWHWEKPKPSKDPLNKYTLYHLIALPVGVVARKEKPFQKTTE